jgi:hypothetical protein
MKNLFLFKEWLGKSPEAKFGFAPNLVLIKKPFYSEEPLERLRSTELLDELIKMGNVNQRIPIKTWSNIVEYGNDPGGLHVSISPLGSFKIIVRKYITDGHGKISPICIDVIPLINDFNHKGDNDPSELILADDIYKRLVKMDSQPLEKFNYGYDKLEDLVVNMAKRCQNQIPIWMKYGGVIKIEDNCYAIWFQYKGYGNGAPNSQKNEKFMIYLQYKPEKGLIHSWGCEINSPAKQREFLSTPSEWDELFSPDQDKNQIVDNLMKIFMTY